MPQTIAALLSCWALLTTMGLMLVGNGMLVTLIGLRAPAEGFSTGTIGIVMAGYYTGMLLGSFVVPRLIARTGHVRILATAAVLYGAGAIAHVLVVDPIAWTLLRFLVGTGSAAIYIVVESWLNDRASNATRGVLLGVYSIVQLGGFAAGQAAIGIVDPLAAEPFLWAALIVTVGALPILLSTMPAPPPPAPRVADPAGLARVAPLAAYGAVAVGMLQGAFYALGTTWADARGLGASGAAIFMALASVGGIVFQFPFGALSDRIDRRIVLAIVAFACSGTGLLLGAAIGAGPGLAQLAGFVMGGLSAVLYTLIVAHANDRVSAEERVPLSGGLILLYGAGAVAGGPVAAQAIEQLGGFGLPLTVAVLGGGIGAYALWRRRRQAAPDEKEGFVPVVAPSAPLPGDPAETTPAETAPAESAPAEAASAAAEGEPPVSRSPS